MVYARFQKQEIVNKPLQRRVTIDILNDDVLLEIFAQYVAKANASGQYEIWQRLVHVCQKWRRVVFRSPLRLDLRILCSTETLVKEKLAVWPHLPIIISQSDFSTALKYGSDNIIAALGHNNRVCKIALTIPGSLLETVFASMRKTFVALKDLSLEVVLWDKPVVPDSFLGGSAPLLRHLSLTRIPFPVPVFWKLLLAAPNLVTLSLHDIPDSTYILPEDMVSCLSALTRLKHLSIDIKSPPVHRQPPSTRSVLSSLTELRFKGASEYLEDLVTRFDAPLLDHLFIRYFHQPIFDIPQLVRFVSRTPSLKAYDKAYLIFSNRHATFVLPGRNNQGLDLGILCRRPDEQLSSMVQVCTSSFTQALVPMLEHLHMLENKLSRPRWQAGLEHNLWLEILHSFSTVKNLYLSREFVPHIVSALQELVAERVTEEVLPNLQSIFLEELGSVPESIRQFIAARQLSSRPIAISHWTGHDRWSEPWFKSSFPHHLVS